MAEEFEVVSCVEFKMGVCGGALVAPGVSLVIG